MAKPVKKRRTQLRAVRSVHLPISLDRKLVKAAEMSKQPVVALIRDAAEAAADRIIAAA